MTSLDSSKEYQAKEEQNFYNAFLKGDLNKIFQLLPKNYAYILQKSGELEADFRQDEIIKQIKSEYRHLFATDLTLDNYRQLKRRANQRILAILKNEKV